MEYKTPREFIENVFYMGTESQPFPAEPFYIMLYEKTKSDDDFNTLWDMEWEEFFQVYGEASKSFRDRKEIFESNVASTIYTLFGNEEAVTEPTAQEAHDILMNISEQIDFPWEDVIEILRKELRNNQGGA